MAAGPDDLCTVADLKAWLPNQGNNDDVTLQNLITNGSAQILQYMNRPHILASVIGTLTENYDGNSADRLLPHFYPLISVMAVSIDGASIPGSTGPTSPGFLFDQRRVMLRGFRFWRGLQNIVLTYTAGFTSVPLDLKQAAIEDFALSYRKRGHIGELSNSMGGQVTVSYDRSASPQDSLDVYSQYKRLAL